MTKRAVVTGANSGIGLATALRLGGTGTRCGPAPAAPTGSPPSSRRRADAGLDAIRPVQLDVTDDASVDAAFAAIQADGPVECWSTTRASPAPAASRRPRSPTYQAMFDTNVLGVVRCIQQVLPGMRAARAGRIVNISSSSAIQSPPLMAAVRHHEDGRRGHQRVAPGRGRPVRHPGHRHPGRHDHDPHLGQERGCRPRTRPTPRPGTSS